MHAPPPPEELGQPRKPTPPRAPGSQWADVMVNVPRRQAVSGLFHVMSGYSSTTPTQYRGYPIWTASNDRRLFTAKNGRWYIGSVDTMQKDSGWLRSAEPHGGAAPHAVPRWQSFDRVGEPWHDDAEVTVTAAGAAPPPGSPPRPPVTHMTSPNRLADRRSPPITAPSAPPAVGSPTRQGHASPPVAVVPRVGSPPTPVARFGALQERRHGRATSPAYTPAYADAYRDTSPPGAPLSALGMRAGSPAGGALASDVAVQAASMLQQDNAALRSELTRSRAREVMQTRTEVELSRATELQRTEVDTLRSELATASGQAQARADEADALRRSTATQLHIEQRLRQEAEQQRQRAEERDRIAADRLQSLSHEQRRAADMEKRCAAAQKQLREEREQTAAQRAAADEAARQRDASQLELVASLQAAQAEALCQRQAALAQVAATRMEAAGTETSAEELRRCVDASRRTESDLREQLTLWQVRHQQELALLREAEVAQGRRAAEAEAALDIARSSADDWRLRAEERAHCEGDLAAVRAASAQQSEELDAQIRLVGQLRREAEAQQRRSAEADSALRSELLAAQEDVRRERRQREYDAQNAAQREEALATQAAALQGLADERLGAVQRLQQELLGTQSAQCEGQRSRQFLEDELRRRDASVEEHKEMIDGRDMMLQCQTRELAQMTEDFSKMRGDIARNEEFQARLRAWALSVIEQPGTHPPPGPGLM